MYIISASHVVRLVLNDGPHEKPDEAQCVSERRVGEERVADGAPLLLIKTCSFWVAKQKEEGNSYAGSRTSPMRERERERVLGVVKGHRVKARVGPLRAR